MTDTESVVESVVRNFYAALGSGDAPTALALLDPAVAWSEAVRSPYYAGVVTGPDAVVRTVLEPITRDFANFACTPSDFITQGERTASFGLYTGVAKVGGGVLKAGFVHLWTVRGGRVVRFEQFTDSGAWEDAKGA